MQLLMMCLLLMLGLESRADMDLTCVGTYQIQDREGKRTIGVEYIQHSNRPCLGDCKQGYNDPPFVRTSETLDAVTVFVRKSIDVRFRENEDSYKVDRTEVTELRQTLTPTGLPAPNLRTVRNLSYEKVEKFTATVTPTVTSPVTATVSPILPAEGVALKCERKTRADQFERLDQR